MPRTPEGVPPAVCRLVPVVLATLAACDGPQSALSPAGRDAETIAAVWWVMAIGAGIIWAAVLGTAVYATRLQSEAASDRAARALILGGGAIAPTIVLGALLIWGLSTMPALLDPGPPGGVKIRVVGEQWWWRVHYALPDGRRFELANELRLPVGQRLPITLETADVIHAFWVPSLSGKIDMVPGRSNLIALEPTRTGVFRGACAEYCGESHARMSLYAVVHEQPAFDAWVEEQLAPAEPPEGALEARGAEVFATNGCAACHTIRGTGADGVVGPDLTHVGSRVSLGAGLIDNEAADFVDWIAHPERFKPGVHMPGFHMLSDDDLEALGRYLEGLQ